MTSSPQKIQQKPITISFLILDESNMLTVASVIDPLRAANRLSATQLFEWQLFSPKGGPIELTGKLQMTSDGSFASSRGGDYLIIVASFNQTLHGDVQLVQDIRKIAGQFKTICGVEAGTWLLARSGLISHHAVTTHWEDLEHMRQLYPDLDIRADRYVLDKNIWTCGGASPALDMMLHLIEKEAGQMLALETASVFIYDQMHAGTDSQPAVSLGKLEADEPRIAAAVRIMEKNIDTPLTISAIAKRVPISVKMLEILFKQHLDQTPGKYYLRLRLNAAKKLLLDTKLSILEISVQCGFESQSSFSRSFKTLHGVNPLAIRLAG